MKITEYSPDACQLLDLINDINCAIYDKWMGKAENTPILVFSSNGDEMDITFLGITLYGNDCDDREHHEETDSYEEFEGYLLRKMNEVLLEINNLKL